MARGYSIKTLSEKRRATPRFFIVLGCVIALFSLVLVLLSLPDTSSGDAAEQQQGNRFDGTSSTPSPYQKNGDPYLVLVNLQNPILDEADPKNLVLLQPIVGDVAWVERQDQQCLEQKTAYALQDMLTVAAQDGMGTYIVNSAYRSVAYQRDIYNENYETYEAMRQNGEPLRAMPGNMSEHSTGLAVDIFHIDYRQGNQGFADTAAAQWLADNCHKYGFILRYPQDKEEITGVMFEPWHFRYVGVEHATKIMQQGLCLEEYLMQ
ncbi:M15 family metallopeptidase [Eubacteriales bacterium OttesenSCG-928-N14]|nr:M15 family metallopeptidase [Eubacteriales bacterium OttesenSCG-928-N14]